MKKIVLSGYYGFNNAGDEAVLYAIINSLKKQDEKIEITVLSNNPEQTAKQYNVKAVNRWKIGEIFNAVKNSNLLISGGGSLLQDVTSKNGILYYLGVIFIAKLLRKPVLIYSQGIGPVNSKRNRLLTAFVLNRVNCITVRDSGSKKDLEEMGVKKEIIVAADPVLGISSDEIKIEKGRELLERVNVNINEGKIMGISIRSWKTSQDNFIALAKACDSLALQGWQVVFIPMHFPEDIQASREVAKHMKEKYFLLKENYTPAEALTIYKNVDMVMGMRLHSLIMAAVAEKPFVAVSYDPKVNRFMELLGINRVLDIKDIKHQEILDLVQNTWENRDEFFNILCDRLPQLREKALIPARKAKELLGIR
ncbi:MAG: polysaccharide pyruvyl transferase CsaB [Clostridia bacterium]|nr:polysaccharide pyruvyl transferase CsaB [Clostridia bacterium]